MWAQYLSQPADPLIVIQQGGIAAAFVVMWWLERKGAAKERAQRDELTNRALALHQLNSELIELVERHTQATARLAENIVQLRDLLAKLTNDVPEQES